MASAAGVDQRGVGEFAERGGAHFGIRRPPLNFLIADPVRLPPETLKEGGTARRSSAFLSQPVLSENPVGVAPALLSWMSLSRQRRPYPQRFIRSPAKPVVFSVWPVVGVTMANGRMTPRL